MVDSKFNKGLISNIDMFRCPSCKSSLIENTHGYICRSCSKEYPNIDGVATFVDTDIFYETLYEVGSIKFVPQASLLHRLLVYFMSMHYFWYLDRFLMPDSQILDVACGGGTRFLTTKGNVVGLDVSLQQLKHLEQLGWYTQTLRASAFNVPYGDETFDAIVAKFFFEHVAAEQKPFLLNEFHRLLKPNGKIIMLFDCECDNWLWRWAKRDKERFQKAFIENDGHYGLIRPSEAIGLIKQNGFRICSYYAANKTPIVHLSMLNWLNAYRGNAWWISPVVGTAKFITHSRLLNTVYTFGVTLWDDLIEHLLPLNHARYLLVVGEKE